MGGGEVHVFKDIFWVILKAEMLNKRNKFITTGT